MERSEFIQVCQSQSQTSNDHGEDRRLSEVVLEAVAAERGGLGLKKLPVIWIETNDSGDNNIATMSTTYPYLTQVLEEMIDLLYSNTFMAAQGKKALDILQRASRSYRGKYTLVVEGAIPTRAAAFNCIAMTDSRCISAMEATTMLGEAAQYVIALGTCASFGGPSSARPNLSGSVGVREVLKRQVINVSGCPVNPDWFIGTLAHLLLYGPPELDEYGRPALFYGFTIHQHCQRRSYFDKGQLAEKIGDIECMFSQGCMGPRTGADCPYRQWINHVSWPVKVNSPCIGCTNPDFPDGSTPFFRPLPEKPLGSRIGRLQGGRGGSGKGGGKGSGKGA